MGNIRVPWVGFGIPPKSFSFDNRDRLNYFTRGGKLSGTPSLGMFTLQGKRAKLNASWYYSGWYKKRNGLLNYFYFW